MNDRPKKRLNRTEKAPSVLGAHFAAMTPEQLRQGMEYAIRTLWLVQRARELARPIAAALLEGPPRGCPPWLHYGSLAVAGLAQVAAELLPRTLEIGRLHQQIELELEGQRWRRRLEVFRQVFYPPPPAAPAPVPAAARSGGKKPRSDTLKYLGLKREGHTRGQIRREFTMLDQRSWDLLWKRADRYDRRHRRKRRTSLAPPAPSARPA